MVYPEADPARGRSAVTSPRPDRHGGQPVISTPDPAPLPEPTEPGHRGSGLRLGQLLMLLGLTGFAVSQPLLAVAGEDPSLFTFAGVRGWGVVVFALAVALLPPLVLWAAVVAVGLVDRRAGDIAFVTLAGLLIGATAIQWVKSAGLERGWALGVIGLLAATGFVFALTRLDAVAVWTRFTAPLPAVAVVLLLVASPAGDLLRSPTEVASTDGGSDMPNVVFIMLDEFPLKTVLNFDDEIDAVRFPNLARLADTSTWYRDYTVNADRTLQSVPSILSGQAPQDGTSALWTDYPDSLFSLLVDTHHFTVSETITQLCGYSTCGVDGAEGDTSTMAGVRRLISQMTDVWKQRVRLGPVDEVDFGQFEEEVTHLDPEEDVHEEEGLLIEPEQVRARPQRVTDFLGSIDPGRSPGLYYLHLMLPHQPWAFYPDGQMHTGMDGIGVHEEVKTNPWVAAQYEQAHITQTRYADQVIGEILDHFDQLDLFDDSLIILTADHGITFDPEGDATLRTLRESNISDLAYVPLMVKSPGQAEGRIDDSNLMGVDVLPLIARELGIEIPWEVDGFAPGSPEIEARGDAKQIYDFGDGFFGNLQGVIEFDSADHRPRAQDRHIGEVTPEDPPHAGLISLLDAQEQIGRDLDEIDTRPSGSAQVVRLAEFELPTEPVPGRIRGHVDDPSLGDLVLVAVDGTVVAAAPIEQDATFSTLMPWGAMEPDRTHDLALVQVEPDAAHLLDLTGGG